MDTRAPNPETRQEDIKNPEREQPPTPPEFTRQEGESGASYLWRMSKSIFKTGDGDKSVALKDPGRMKEEDLSYEDLKRIEIIMQEAVIPGETQPTPKEIFEAELNAVLPSIGTHAHAAVSGSQSSGIFDRTERNRKFFETGIGSAAKRETYWNTTFFPFTTHAGKAYARSLLQNKRIMLFGGDRSTIGTELKGEGITVKKILNIDPFVEEPLEDSDPVAPYDVTDSNLSAQLNAEGYEASADEIAAVFSVPAYVEDAQSIKNLFQNISVLLAPNGTARIWPLMVSGNGEPAEIEKRKKALTEALQKIHAEGIFQISFYSSAGRPGCLIHKCAKNLLETN